VSRWRKDGDTFRLETEIPEGVSATAILPSGETKALRSGRQTLKETARPAAGVTKSAGGAPGESSWLGERAAHTTI